MCSESTAARRSCRDGDAAGVEAADGAATGFAAAVRDLELIGRVSNRCVLL